MTTMSRAGRLQRADTEGFWPFLCDTLYCLLSLLILVILLLFLLMKAAQLAQQQAEGKAARLPQVVAMAEKALAQAAAAEDKQDDLEEKLHAAQSRTIALSGQVSRLETAVSRERRAKKDAEQSSKLAEQQAAKLQAQINSMPHEIARLEQAAAQARQAKQELKSAVESVAIDLVFVVDASQSWQAAQPDLFETITHIAELLPKITPEVRIGVIVYRWQIVQRYSLRIIKSDTVDGGASLRSLQRNVLGIKPIGTLVNVELAINEGLKWLSNTSRRTILITVGDVGTDEMDGTRDSYSWNDKQARNRVLNRAKAWCAGHENRRLLTMYTGTEQRGMHIDFYRDLAAVGGSQGLFCDNASKMVTTILEAALAK